jgi:6-phosphogluconolactonase
MKARFLTISYTLLISGILLSTVCLSQGAGGVVFVNANDSTANAVWMYKRATNGQLTFFASYPTQGTGTGTAELASQGSLALALNNRYLYAVNGGSNQITAFQVKATGLVFIANVSSGGTWPNSLTVFGNLLYVLNAYGDNVNISGFRIKNNGTLVPIAGSTLPLSSDLPVPTQIGFTPDGKNLYVTEKIADTIDTYAVGLHGLPTGPTPQASAGGSPFGFAFDHAGHVVISEIANSAASSYSWSSDGTLEVITAHLTDFGKAACWTVITNNLNFPQQYAYITNTHSDTVSGYAIAADGSISLVNPDGKTAILPQGAYPLDMVIDRDNKYLYVLNGHLPGIAGYSIQSDGNLVQIQDLRGTPGTSWGIAGY